MWAIFKRQNSSEPYFELIQKVKDAHQRIIWGINWSHDDSLIATASREKQKSVKIWYGPNNSSESERQHSELPTSSVPSATALRFFPRKV